MSAENSEPKGHQTKGKKPILRAIPLHPFILALYFVLALLGLNITQLSPLAATRSLLIALSLAGVLLILMFLLLKGWLRGALAASLMLILFFTYGHLYNFIEKTVPAMGRHRLLLPLWLLLAIVGVWVIARWVKDLSLISRALTITSLVAIAFPVYQIARWEIRQVEPDENAAVRIQGIGELKLEPGQASPDVYFIVLDMYARQDLLEKIYYYDNSEFLDELRAMGFSIIECSQSNYSQTEMVLASILNMNYLDELGEFDDSIQGTSALRHLIQDNTVMAAFKALGYTLVSFETGYPFSEFKYADVYLTPAYGNNPLLGRMNPFEALLVRSTISLALTDFAKVLPSFLIPKTDQPLETKRELVQFDLESLSTMPGEIPGPKFVFAHILALHEPYVFAADGSAATYPEMMDTEQSYAAYRDQLEFIDTRMMPILQEIIEHSSPKPIIILQGDTGPGLVSHSGRMANLSAFYLPGFSQSIPATFTPVNDFRIIFDHYFGGNLGLLPDTSYFSLYTSPYEQELIPNDCVAGSE